MKRDNHSIASHCVNATAIHVIWKRSATAQFYAWSTKRKNYIRYNYIEHRYIEHYFDSNIKWSTHSIGF